MVQVLFNYDEALRKWEVFVTGAKDETEARQAFAAVVVTCCDLDADLLDKTKVIELEGPGSEAYKIIPAVRGHN